MNALDIADLLNQLPDDMIVSANVNTCRQQAVQDEPEHSRAVRRYGLYAIAAVLVLLIAAAVYPKLRTQKPEVTDPPVMTAETTVSVTDASERTAATATQTVSTTAQTAAATATTDTTTVTVSVETELPETEVSSAATAAPETTALQAQTESVQTESFTDASQTAIKTSEITEALQTVTTVSEPNVKRISISLKKGQTSNIPYNHSGGSPAPGTDTPGGSNQTKLKTETVVTEKYLKFTMPVACQDAVLLSIEYNDYCIEAKFLYLPYFESQTHPKTVYYYVTLPDDFDDMLFSAFGEVSETVDPAAFAEAGFAFAGRAHQPFGFVRPGLAGALFVGL